MKCIKLPFITFVLSMLLSLTVSAMDFKENTHYFKVENAKPGSGQKVEVVEFFNYACPHCMNIEPHIQNWLKTADQDTIDFVHIPAYWNKLFQNTAQAFYTAKALGVSETIHKPLFEAIHQKNLNFSDVSVIEEVFVEQGVKPEDFQKQYNSFFVNQQLAMGNKRFIDYKLKSVPSFVIDGQWRTSLQEAGSHENLFLLIEHLVEKSLKSR